MKRFRCSLFFLFGAVLHTAHFQPIEAGETLEWTGCGVSRTAYMQALAEAYEKKTGIKILISGGGATKGIRKVAAGSSDMGGSCRHLLRDQVGDVLDEEKGVELIPVSWDALVVIVNEENPVSTISFSQIQDVLRGRITNWRELGGKDQKLLVVMRESKTSGVGLLLRQLILNDEHYEPDYRHIMVQSTGPLENCISRVKEAIGIDGISSARKVPGVKTLALDGIQPTKENLISGRYKLFRPMYLSVPNNYQQVPRIKRFVDFVTSDDGQRVISEQGTVNLTEGRLLQEKWIKR